MVNYNKYFDFDTIPQVKVAVREEESAMYLQKGRLYLSGSGISPRGKSPKLARIGFLENCM